MRCTNKRFISLIMILCLVVSSLTGCSSKKTSSVEEVTLDASGLSWIPFSEYTAADHITTGRSSIIKHNAKEDRFDGFSSDLCVFSDDVSSSDFDATMSTASLLIKLDDNSVLYAENAFERRYPASLTKLLTGYTALKYMDIDSTVTVTSEALDSITDPEAVMLNVKVGDTMTLDQALRLMYLSSYNDVAEAIGCSTGGSMTGFSDLMNKTALELGCTGTHFSNASGLHEDDHYTTAYDLYLIFKEVIKNPTILEIIQMRDYSTAIKDAAGNDYNVISRNTNKYFRGTYPTPENLVIVGGKTGTTDEGGRSLVLLVRDVNSVPYIAIVMGAESYDDLYNEMTAMLSLCNVTVN